MTDTLDLINALKAAKCAGELVRTAQDIPKNDLDTGVLVLSNYTGKQIEAAAKKAGVWLGKRFHTADEWMIGLLTKDGNGYDPTAVCEAMVDSLKASGFESHMLYIVD